MTDEFIDNHPKWSASKKLLILFLLSYFFLYMFPFPLEDIPFIKDIIIYYSRLMEFITLWIGRNLFQLNTLEKIEITGSGDTTFDYIKLITLLFFSIFLSVVIFIFTRKQKNYSELYNYLIIYARYYVGLYLLSYGLSKVFGGQFVYPDYNNLEEPYGNSSPMGLLWTFMGYSKSYTVFSGIGEIVGGFLLFFRRTTVLGCIISIIVMLNVVMLNFSYDVPVKLFSSHLVLISLFILAPFIKKLLNFLIFHKTTELSFEKLHYTKKWMRIVRVIFKLLIIAGIPLFGIIEEVQQINEYDKKNGFEGLYKTDFFVFNKDTLAPLTTNTLRWDKLIIESGSSSITSMTNSNYYYQINIDSLNHTITLSDYNDSLKKYIFNYKIQTDNHLSISGFYMKDSIYAVFKKKTLNEFPLVNRGFNWINEYPFNR